MDPHGLSRFSLILPFLVLVVGACGGDAPSARDLAANQQSAAGTPADAGLLLGHDSAGVRIIEYSEDAWNSAPVWRLAPERSLSIGVVAGDPEYEFDSITGALRLDDGTIAVLDGGARELKFYDAQGTFINAAGRQGAGPGEYRFPAFLARRGPDSLLVWDGPLQRGSVLDRDGTFAHLVSPPDTKGDVQVLDTFGDGSLLATASDSYGFMPGDLPLGMIRIYCEYIRFSPSAQSDTIARLFVDDEYNTPGMYHYDTPFGRHAVAAAGERYLHYSSSDTYEIRTYAIDGSLVRIVRFARVSPLTRQDIDDLVENTDDPETRRYLAGFSYPETMPSYAVMQVDADGNLWIGDYLRPGEDARGWTILGPAGQFLGRLVTPPRFTVYQIGSDYVLGSAPGAMDVQRVLMYPLVRNR